MLLVGSFLVCFGHLRPKDEISVMVVRATNSGQWHVGAREGF